MKVLGPLFGLFALACTGPAQAAPACSIALRSDDRMLYDLERVTVSAACPQINVVLTHVGSLPVGAMGHNVVIATRADAAAVAQDGARAGAAAGYVAGGDRRVLAATRMVGGGESARTSFPGKRLVPGVDYVSFCSFPGHFPRMKGTLSVTR